MASSSKRELGYAPHLRQQLLSEADGGAGSGGVGGVLRALTSTIANSDTAAKTLFVLPADAILIDIHVDVTTAFNSSGTDLLSIGKSGTNSFFKSNLDVSSLGQTVTGWSALGAIGTSALSIVAIYAQSVADSSTGAARITFRYIDG